jgi:hypothetical protein
MAKTMRASIKLSPQPEKPMPRASVFVAGMIFGRSCGFAFIGMGDLAMVFVI